MSAEENKRIVEKFWTTYCTVNAQEGFDLLADDLEWHIMGKDTVATPGPISKDTFFAVLLATGGSLHPDRRPNSVFTNGMILTVHIVIAEGNHVVLEGESHATAANGKHYNNRYSLHCELENGKIKTVREYEDTRHQWDVMSDVFHLATD